MFQFLLAADAQFTQEGHHGAPIGEARLEQVETHEGGEEIPVLIHLIPKGQGNHDKESSDQAEHACNRHCCSPY